MVNVLGPRGSTFELQAPSLVLALVLLVASLPLDAALLLCISKPLRPLPPDVVLEEVSEKIVAGIVLLTWRVKGKLMVARPRECVDACQAFRKTVGVDLLTCSVDVELRASPLEALFPNSPENSNRRLTVSGPLSPAEDFSLLGVSMNLFSLKNIFTGTDCEVGQVFSLWNSGLKFGVLGT